MTAAPLALAVPRSDRLHPFSDDDSLVPLLDLSRQLAGELRDLALAVDADPRDAALVHGSPALELLRVIGTPESYRPYPVPRGAGQFTRTCLARVAANIELARGDAGVLNACPAPSLAGLTVDALGTPAQRDLFYAAMAERRSWSFFGMTEPQVGSDATAMQTRLEPGPGGGFRLSGGKRYVAQAGRGAIGVVWARTGPTPLSIRAVLVRQPAAGVASGHLDMIGLRGACFGELSFREAPVEPGAILAAHLPASRRGMWAAIRAFNVIRTQIAAQAVGTALAIRDCARELRPGWAGHEPMSARLAAARELLYDCARAVDRDPDDRQPPSLAKLHAASLAVEVTRWAEAALGAGALTDHPLLEKWCRDVHAFEFMDGTTNMLRLTLAPAPPARRERP